jgi:hypothetical protein
MITLSHRCIFATLQILTAAVSPEPICCEAESGDRCGYPECGAAGGYGLSNAACRAADRYSADIDFSR